MSIRPLGLPGWEDLSTWGYDSGAAGFYAQLTRNGGNDDNGPEIWITPPRTPAIRSEVDLAAVIAEMTGTAVDDVSKAMRY